MEKSVVLKPGKEIIAGRMHPWIFSGAIGKEHGQPKDGDRVAVLDSKGNRLATGHYQEGSIRVRVIHFGPAAPSSDFWASALAKAWRTRQVLNLGAATNAFRLVHGAGDGLPGLIVDVYNDVVVVQCHSWGMYAEIVEIAEAIKSTAPLPLRAIYTKSEATLAQRPDLRAEDRCLYGEAPQADVLENGHQFKVDPETGQKTGFFLDQRDNRQLLAHYAPGKRVLNTFCYSGGFSVYALAAGASQVTSVDVSEKAMQLTYANVAANAQDMDRHEGHTQDVMQFLRQNEGQYDIVIVDPPAFAKSVAKRHNAVQAYKRLNALAIARLQPGGLLFTFSCSQVVDRQLFYDTIVAAGLEAGRSARVLHLLSQGPDHPVNLFQPEGEYLKGLVVQVD